jgi:outer membrane murein-binding lipoprotein Lpp
MESVAGDGIGSKSGALVRMAAAAAVLGWGSLAGCAADSNQPPPTKKEIQSDSDRLFEKVKQEERERGKGSESVRP